MSPANSDHTAIRFNRPGIYYVTGNAAAPLNLNPARRIIAHIVNDCGAWGAGFTRSLQALRYPEVYFRLWAHNRPTADLELRSGPYGLGAVQIADGSIPVANLCAQHKIKSKDVNVPPIRYKALSTCLYTLDRMLKEKYDISVSIDLPAQVHMPRIGCGLAGGTWEHVLPIVADTLKNRCVVVYDLPVNK